MPEIVITCGQCERQLRVPEEMLGRLVKCPACGFTFTARPGDERPAEAPGDGWARSDGGYESPAMPPAHRGDSHETSHEQSRAAVTAPAVCLLITALFGMAFPALFALVLVAMGDEVKAEALRDAQRRAQPGQPAPSPEAFDLGITFLKTVHLLSVPLAVVTLIGSIQMLRLRTHWLAVTGSILAMINVGCGCLLLGLPFGIWSLVVLLRPDVKNLFAS